jgi:hypothetical protein
MHTIAIDEGKNFSPAKSAPSVLQSRFHSMFQTFTAPREGFYSWFYDKQDYRGHIVIVELTSGYAEEFCNRANKYQSDLAIKYYASALRLTPITSDLSSQYPGLAGTWTAIRMQEVTSV